MEPYVCVDQTTCRSSTDSSDDIYLLVFRGRTRAPFHNSMSVIHPAAFADFEDGQSRGNDIKIGRYFDDSVYVVGLLERDDDNDLLEDDAKLLDLVRAQANLAWVTRMGALNLAHSSHPSDEQLESSADIVITAIEGSVGLATKWPVGDDDPIGRSKHLKIAPGQEPVLGYSGEGANYSIRFKVRDF
jgi:hypothetical protein